METTTPIAPTLDDMVFEHRNKRYGAYPLRQAYTRRLQYATAIGIAVFGVCMAVLWHLARPSAQESLIIACGPFDEPYTVTRLELPVPPAVPPPPPPKAAPSVRFVEMTPAPPDEREPAPATVAQLDGKAIADATHEGDGTLENLEVSGTGEAPGLALAEEPAAETPLLIADEMPEFKDMARFLSRHLRYPASARLQNISGSVYVGFVVDSQGQVADVRVLKGIEPACDAEAVRVVRLMPRWKPGRQQGRAVAVRYALPIRFTLQSAP